MQPGASRKRVRVGGHARPKQNDVGTLALFMVSAGKMGCASIIYLFEQ